MQQSSNLIKAESLRDYEYLSVVVHGAKEYIVLKPAYEARGQVRVLECAREGGYRGVADEAVERAVLRLFQRSEQDRGDGRGVRLSA